MKAYVYGANGAAITDVAKPVPKGTQVLVRVHACGLNRADLGMTKGHVHGSAGGVGTVLGMEWAGEVAELGRLGQAGPVLGPGAREADQEVHRHTGRDGLVDEGIGLPIEDPGLGLDVAHEDVDPHPRHGAEYDRSFPE